MIISALIIFLIVFLLSGSLVWLVLRYSEKHSVLDLPNERSSHTEPTATGGGLAIATCIITGSLLLWWYGFLEDGYFYAIFPTMIVISITGWLDDHKHIGTIYRALIYFSSALWVAEIAGGFVSLNLGGNVIGLGLSGVILAILGIVWMTNLYNFMDGIDGLAAIEAITVGLAGGVFLFFSGMTGEAILCLILIAATTAYLKWNWPPAKIFMGDVGSCPLGFIFAALAVWSHNHAGPAVYVWLILLSVFVADATYTLILRLLQRHKWYSAHRSHAYQKLAQMGYTHGKVTLGVLALNVIVIWPMACFAHIFADQAVYITTFIYILLAIIWGFIQTKSRHYKHSNDIETCSS